MKRLQTTVCLLAAIVVSTPCAPPSIAAADPLNLLGILTPDGPVPSTALRTVELV